MEIIDKEIEALPKEAPKLYEHIKSYGEQIKRKIEIYKWEPLHTKHCSTNITPQSVATKKNNLLKYFQNESSWEDYNSE